MEKQMSVLSAVGLMLVMTVTAGGAGLIMFKVYGAMAPCVGFMIDCWLIGLCAVILLGVGTGHAFLTTFLVFYCLKITTLDKLQ